MAGDRFTFNPFIFPQTANAVQDYSRKMSDVATAVAAIQRSIDPRGWEGLAFDASANLSRVVSSVSRTTTIMDRLKAELDLRATFAESLFVFTPFPLAGEAGNKGEKGKEGEGQDGEPWDAGSPSSIMDPEAEAEASLKLAESKAHKTFGPNFDWNHTFGSKENGLSVDAHALQGNLDAHGGLSYGKDGLTLDGGASAAFDLLAVQAKATGTLHTGPLTTSGDVAAAGKVDARASGSGSLSVGKGGVGAGVDAQAFAGAEAQASAHAGADVAGVDTKVGASGGVMAGAGAWAKADATISPTHIKASLDLGAAVGVGLSVKVGIDVNATGAVHTLEHGAEKVVSVLNPLNW